MTARGETGVINHLAQVIVRKRTMMKQVLKMEMLVL